jgi:phosphatidylglycerol lysyltransferase
MRLAQAPDDASDREAFIMYQISGNSWIAMGDPVGPVDCHQELTWAFREMVDRHDGHTVFYQVADESLPLYVDLGLTLSKLGEDATASLRDFSLQGSDRAELRQALNRTRKNGAVFQVVPRTAVTSIMGDLRRVSDAWLADKSSAEKGFSLGSFSESYIANFDCAVVRVHNEIVAFANLWPAPASAELSVDLMRYVQSAPKGIMDYLFVELMLWGSANGYQCFSLGMAPLSGLEKRSLAPLWHKIGHLIFTHGENFYNFEGLRNYKQKFNPEWQPRYLACPGGWRNLPTALIDVSRLIAGGVTGMV